jgi:two-component system, OmpR family, response regulator TctD
MKVLLVEDTQELALWLGAALRKMGLDVTLAVDGSEAAHLLLDHDYKLVILDLNLPKRDGLSVLQEIRSRKDYVPVLILTARADVSDRVKGLNAGADDYLPKPFDLEELDARVHALLRRAPQIVNEIESYGPISYEKSAQSFFHKKELIALTPRESKLLSLLFERKNRVVAKEFLHEQVFQNEPAAVDAIEVLVYRIRKKINQELGCEVATVRGIGYILRIEP